MAVVRDLWREKWVRGMGNGAEAFEGEVCFNDIAREQNTTSLWPVLVSWFQCVRFILCYPERNGVSC